MKKNKKTKQFNDSPMDDNIHKNNQCKSAFPI